MVHNLGARRGMSKKRRRTSRNISSWTTYVVIFAVSGFFKTCRDLSLLTFSFSDMARFAVR